MNSDEEQEYYLLNGQPISEEQALAILDLAFEKLENALEASDRPLSYS